MKAFALVLVSALVAILFLTSTAIGSDGSTELSIEPPEAASPGLEFVVSAILREHGAPLPSRELVFARETTFGAIEVGRATTDSVGRAGVVLSVSSPGPVVLLVTFEGDGTLRASAATSTVLVGGGSAPGPDYTAVLLVGAIVAVVVGSVWACYAFVVVQIWEIRAEGRRAAAGRGREVDR